MNNILELLKSVDIQLNIVYNKIIKNTHSILIVKSSFSNSTVREIKELVTIYEQFYSHKNIKIDVLANGDILIQKASVNH
ncbi:MAG: hypothetical protein PHS65_07245 [Arcobacteraceae bacterium]|jgi:hypothetical protein|nr:hypothetical protein [Arcobacteraceae bacterium]MDX9796596.1 hypothetical protein [Arcobacteraceae bacterium]